MKNELEQLTSATPDRTSKAALSGPPLRLLHVGAGNLYGGVESMLMTLAAAQPITDGGQLLTHHFCLCFEGRFSESLRENGVQPYDLGATRLSRPWTVLRARSRLRRVLATSGPYDFIVCHSAWTMAVFGRSLRAQRAGGLVFWLHSAPDGKHWLERLARWTRPSLAICNSGFTAALLPFLYPDLRPAVVYCPVGVLKPILSRHNCRVSLGADLCTPIILLLARMEERKGHRCLIEALHRIQNRSWECWIAGGPQKTEESDYLEALHKLVRERGLSDRIRFLGERTDVGDLLQAADILCHPHITPEPFGIAIAEAMSAGLVVVASNLGGPREVLTSECGVLTRPLDAAALADAIEDVLAMPLERRTRMSLAARARATELCSPTATMERLNAFLRPEQGKAAASAPLPFWSSLKADLLAHIPTYRREDGRAARFAQDLRNTFLSSGFHMTLLYRAGHSLRSRFGLPGRVIAFAAYWIGRHWYGCSISPKARLGGGVIFPHPHGVVIGPEVVVGDRAWIYQNVTLGGGNDPGMPCIGHDARVYTGAVVVGGVRCGDSVSIGANTVVTFDLPDGARVRPAAPAVKGGYPDE